MGLLIGGCGPSSSTGAVSVSGSPTASPGGSGGAPGATALASGAESSGSPSPGPSSTLRDTVTAAGRTVSVDLVSATFVLFVATAQNPTVANRELTFRIDPKTTKMSILGQRVATSLADLGLRVGESNSIVFNVSSYDPLSRTYLMLVIQRTPAGA